VTQHSAIKKVILCADGDSNDIDLWSNIPFLLATELDRRGISIIAVCLTQPLWIRRLWRYTLGVRHKLRHWRTSTDFYRSATNHWLTTRKLNQAIRRHGESNTILINLSISFAPTRSSIPVVLLSDWSYHYYITERLSRQPDYAERGTIARDTAAMARASLVVLLFPESAARLQCQIPEGRFRFLGHVINDHPLAPLPPPQPPASIPHRPWRLLFIGRPRYREGLERLLAALSLLPADLPVQLDVIGIDASDLAQQIAPRTFVNLHGYLSKAEELQRITYYELLNQADIVINASCLWGGFSSTVEAMHRRTAVLTPPYQEFQALFGAEIDFGVYLYRLEPHYVADSIAALLQCPTRLSASQEAAHLAVQVFTWCTFVERVFREVSALPAALSINLDPR
jgi:glycosyltransferase involved in cell wall biosynthesis